MSVRIRADLVDLPDYVPGRKISGAINLASNEVSYPPLPAVLSAVTQAATEINRYPAMGADAVTSRLAEHYGVQREQLAIGCGSVSLCQQLVQALCLPGDEVLFAWRSFEAYPIITQIVGATRRTVPLDHNFRHDLAATMAAITDRTKLIFISNPLNPTGTALRRTGLRQFLQSVPENILVVLDEAYREFVTDPEVPDGCDLAARYNNVAVLRTFSKAFGLAGVRVGYCLAPVEVAAGIRKVGIPFAVNRFAQAAALAALDSADELMARCALISNERERVRQSLLLAGFTVPESQANFVWLPLGERTTAFYEHCLHQRIVLRAFESEGVRATIGQPSENDAFLAAANSFSG